MNFLHCFYGLGAVISPYIMALALKTARWNEGYRWTAFLQTGILLVVLCSLPLWHQNEQPDEKQAKAASAGIKEVIRQRGVITTLLAFLPTVLEKPLAFYGRQATLPGREAV
jgi:fucose permease